MQNVCALEAGTWLTCQASASRLLSTQLPQLLLSEQMGATTSGFGEYHRQISLLSDLRASRGELDARARVCVSLASLIRVLSTQPLAGGGQASPPDVAAAAAALAGSLGCLQERSSLQAVGEEPQAVASTAVSLLLACEGGGRGVARPSASSLADELEIRAAEVHEVVSVVALALEHESREGQTKPAGAEALSCSSLKVRLHVHDDELCFVLAGGGLDGTRVLYPNGW